MQDDTSATLPWGTPGTKVTANHIVVSKNYYARCIEVYLKVAFEAGLRDSIKRQTLIQPSEGLSDLLAIAQRVEASQREVQPRAQVAAAQAQEEVSEDEHVEAAAATYPGTSAPQQRQAPTSIKGNREGKFGRECFYCFKPYHMKKNCLTRRQDCQKDIY